MGHLLLFGVVSSQRSMLRAVRQSRAAPVTVVRAPLRAQRAASDARRVLNSDRQRTHTCGPGPGHLRPAVSGFGPAAAAPPRRGRPVAAHGVACAVAVAVAVAVAPPPPVSALIFQSPSTRSR